MHRSSISSSVRILLATTVVVSLGLATGCSKSQEEKREEFLKTAARMGQIDRALSANAIQLVEGGVVQQAGWQTIDETMDQATPETRRSYREWRDDVVKNGLQQNAKTAK